MVVRYAHSVESGSPRPCSWGISDGPSWLTSQAKLSRVGASGPRPLLWDDAYQKKPAHDGVMDALRGL